MGQQKAVNSSGCNKRKYEDTNAAPERSEQGSNDTLNQSVTDGGCPEMLLDGASASKNPRLEEAAMNESTENPSSTKVATGPTRSITISSNSNNSSSITIRTVASVLVSGTPSTVQSNSPLILPPAAPAEDSIAKLEAVAVPGETNWNCDSNVDPISKLQAVAVPGEAWGSDSTRSTLATTLLVSDDLDDDDDDFEDDFDDDETILPSYSPIRYPCATGRGGYMPAYPKPGYFPEPYQNCSRTNAANNGAQQYANRGYGWSQHGYYSPPYEAPSSQQTIRCAENGKSYFELGSANYSNVNQFGAQARHLKRCCDGRNMSCNNKQCYKERRLKMMNLSMFKLARFRQASDQSLYRSVLICNTLKSIEREIDHENKEFNHQQHLHQHSHHYHAPPPHHLHHPHHQHPPPSPQTPTPPNEYVNGPLYNNSRIAANDKQQQQQPTPKFSDTSNNGSSNYSRLQGSNTTTQSSSTYGTSTNCTADQQQSTTITTQLSPYDQQQPQQQHHLGSLAAVTTASPTTAPSSHHHHHPLKDPQSGRATPFPSSTGSLTGSGYHDNDSGFGDDDCTRPINWGSVLSLSSQSALDPLNNNDLFVTSPSVAVSVVNDSHHAVSATVLASNDNCDSSNSLALSQSTSSASCLTNSDSGPVNVSSVNNSDSSSESNHHHNSMDSTNPASSSTTNASSTTTLTSLTTLTTSSNCDLNLTTLTTSPSPLLSSCASALQYHTSTTGSSWDLAYLDMDLGTTHELYDMFPNCYKITSFNSDVDMLGLKSPMLEPSKVVCDNDMDSFTTHIMVGS
ncbi:uncharacterized protein LOC131677115 [Topomyia yanbarensis]|uniref:uncharacterized protein LOC131677115 n=1 Tax=Topomyia yanbarensis TaxID=2498891 RepID=UPI00273BCBFD|nr:uncharacterized protein LOC131677115 [Topomyia yanbarensis]XP_058812703.1 uncharacterized protein LOC131677115 [Topomyia yanbarensis]